MFGSTFARRHFKRKNEDIEEILKKIVGHVVVCEDHLLRKVYNAVTPVSDPAARNGLIIINEGDPLMPTGHWVTLLAVTCALEGLKQPDKEQREAFRRLSQNLRSANLKQIYEAQRAGKMPFEIEK